METPQVRRLRPRHASVGPGRGGNALAVLLLPPILRPAVKAYLLGYASVVAPRILTLILQHFSKRRRRKTEAEEDVGAADKSAGQPQGRRQRQQQFITSLKDILRKGLDPHHFPTFCAVIVGGSTILEASQRVPLRADTPAFSTGPSEAAHWPLPSNFTRVTGRVSD